MQVSRELAALKAEEIRLQHIKAIPEEIPEGEGGTERDFQKSGCRAKDRVAKSGSVNTWWICGGEGPQNGTP